MKKILFTIIVVSINATYCYSQLKPCDYYSTLPQVSTPINEGFDFSHREDSIVKKLKPYIIKKTNNVNFVKIKKNLSIPADQVEIKLIVDKRKEYFNTIELSASSGYQVLASGSIAFKEVSFPFEGAVKFHVTGQFIITEFIDVEFIINEACGWTVEIFE